MRPLTLILPFYRNAGMLREQQAAWRALPRDIRKRLHVIVVDDGSPKRLRALPSVESDRGAVASFRLYRLLEDVRWNWIACRNLGVAEASATDWVLMTDIDHVVPEATWRALMTGELAERSVHRFSRVDAPHPLPWSCAPCACGSPTCVGLTAYRPHPNSWFMTRGMFDKVGGYDERLSGCYGTDGEFRDRVHATAESVVVRADVLVRYPREVIPDASTTVFTRKGDKANDDDLRRRRDERTKLGDWRPLRGTFRWERVI